MKQCEKCGNGIEEGAAFCTHCGAPVRVMEGNLTGAGGVAMNTTAASVITNAPIVNSASDIGMPPKKKMNGAIIALAVACVVCLTVGIVGIVVALNSNKGDSDKQVAVDTGTSGGSTADVVSSGTKVSYAGYEFAIPKGYNYELTETDGEKVLLFSDSDDYLAMVYYGNDATFASIESNANMVADSLALDFGTSVKTTTTTVGGVDFVCFNIGKVEVEGVNVLYAASEADLYYFETTILTNLGVDGTEYLNNIAEVLKTAQKKTTMNRSLGNGDGLSGLKRASFNVVVEE